MWRVRTPGSPTSDFASKRIGQQLDQRPDIPMRGNGMPERQRRVDLVIIPTAGADSLQVMAGFKIRDDSLDLPFGNPN